MAGRNVTRVDLCEAVYQKVGLSRSEALAMVELVLKEIMDPLAEGETVKLSSFGTFSVGKKKQRMGRNPKNGVPAQVSARRVVVFKPSAILKQQINGERSGTNTLIAELGSSALLRPRSADVRS
jgi:integration host factor subunit alpha